ncbi:MAG: aminotransferase class III-fold pyridoxal phosphate-dependent enzyme [bacterium]|nr:aminotransferase class III-fold pyridoxal phosphate-dependent enzyme [bacterium]
MRKVRDSGASKANTVPAIEIAALRVSLSRNYSECQAPSIARPRGNVASAETRTLASNSKGAVGLAKPLGGGFPLSAVVGRQKILDVDLYTAYTLGGSPLACSAAVAVLDVIEEEGLVRNAEEMGRYLRDKLDEMRADHPLIGDVRGKGLLIGVELVKDHRTREPAETDAYRLAYRCFELGLILLAFGNVMEITPPLTITRSDADEALDIFDRALADIEAGRFDDSKLPDFLGH